MRTVSAFGPQTSVPFLCTRHPQCTRNRNQSPFLPGHEDPPSFAADRRAGERRPSVRRSPSQPPRHHFRAVTEGPHRVPDHDAGMMCRPAEGHLSVMVPDTVEGPLPTSPCRVLSDHTWAAGASLQDSSGSVAERRSFHVPLNTA